MARHSILLHIDGPIVLLIPNGRLVVPVHHDQFDFDVGVQGRSPTIAGPHSENELSPLVVWREIRHRQLASTMASGMQQ